jgi:hypothetical protein
MAKDVVVTPTRYRDDMIKNIRVLLFCKCGAEVSDHPTERCLSFNGHSVREIRQ